METAHRWMFVWMTLLGTTVAYQRRKKEAAKMRQKWEEMKREENIEPEERGDEDYQGDER